MAACSDFNRDTKLAVGEDLYGNESMSGEIARTVRLTSQERSDFSYIHL